MSKYKNFHSSIIYFVQTITMKVSIIGADTHLLALVIYDSITKLYCLQPIVLGIILMELNQDMSSLTSSIALSIPVVRQSST
jgi:hypothetical protein